MLKTEYTRFKIKKGKEKRVDKWMKILNQRIMECEKTLSREKMFVEAIFRETINAEEYISWFSMQGGNGKNCDSSNFEIDKIHQKFWKECIDDNDKGEDQKLQLLLLNKKIFKAIG